MLLKIYFWVIMEIIVNGIYKVVVKKFVIVNVVSKMLMVECIVGFW